MYPSGRSGISRNQSGPGNGSGLIAWPMPVATRFALVSRLRQREGPVKPEMMNDWVQKSNECHSLRAHISI